MGGNLNQSRKSLIITCSQSLNHRMYSPLSHIKHDQIFQGDVFASQECILAQSFKVKITLFHVMFLCDRNCWYVDMMQLNRYTKQVFNDVKVQYRMCQYYTVNTEHGYEKCKDQDQTGHLGSRSPRGETALAGEGEGVRFTFDQIIIEQVKTK